MSGLQFEGNGNPDSKRNRYAMVKLKLEEGEDQEKESGGYPDDTILKKCAVKPEHPPTFLMCRPQV